MVRKFLIFSVLTLFLVGTANAGDCITNKMEKFSIQQAEFHQRMIDFKNRQVKGNFDYDGWGEILEEWGELLDEWGMILEMMQTGECCDYIFYTHDGEKICVHRDVY